MSDRELLEAAAKATGQQWRWVTCQRYANEVPGMWLPDAANDVEYFVGWNPLEDDSDALRLAVKLKIMVDQTDDSVDAFVPYPASLSTELMYSEPLGGDPYAATRRAIVRAAAALAGDREQS